jgi:multiple sugar transport system substrate-binding protein
VNRLHIALAAVVVVGGVSGFRQISWHPPDDVLVMWVRGTPEQTAIYRQSLDDYLAEHDDAHWRMEVIPSRAILQKFLTGVDAGHAPDVVNLHWNQTPQAASTGQLIALDSLLERDHVDPTAFYPIGLQAYRYRDELFGMPIKGATVCGFFNRSLFDKYGVEYPSHDWTWAEMLRKAKLLTVDEDGDGLPDVYGLSPYDIANYVWSGGGHFVRWEQGRWVSNLDDPATIDAVGFFVDLFWKHKVSPPRPGIRTEAPMSTFTFEAGRIAIELAGPWRIPDYQYIDRFDWDTLLFPRGPAGRNTRYAGSALVIWKGTRRPEEAWRLVRHMTGPEATAKMAKIGSDMPPLREVAQNAFANPNTHWNEDVFIEAMEYDVRIFPAELWWDDLFRKMQDELDAALTGRETVEEAMADAHRVTVAYLQRLYASEESL